MTTQTRPAQGYPALAAGLVCLAAQLMLVWGHDFFPTVDGPAHVHMAHALHEALRGDGFYASLVELNRQISPNLATQGVLVALMAVAPPFVAEKLWLTLYFMAFAGASAYALSGINRNSLYLLPLLMFCSVSFPLAFGFYNFTFSTVVLLAWFGFWWRYRHTSGVRVTLLHALFALAAFTTHIFAFVISLAAIGVTGLAEAATQLRRAHKGASGQPRHALMLARSALLPPLLGSLPELAFCGYYLLVRLGSQTAAGAANLALSGPARIEELVMAASFAPYDATEAIAAFGFVGLLLIVFALLVRQHGSARESLPFAACFLAFLAIYLVMPERWIVRWMPARFQPLVFVMLILWLAALSHASLTMLRRSCILAAGTGLVVFSAWLRTDVFARINGYYQELSSLASHIPERSSLVTLRLHEFHEGRPFPAKVDVFIQAGSRLASDRHSVDLKNFQGQSRDHPIQFRKGVSATAALGGDRSITSVPPRVDLMNYEATTGRPIDFVLLYGFPREADNISAIARIFAQLDESYSLLQVSGPLGLARLYARKPEG